MKNKLIIIIESVLIILLIGLNVFQYINKNEKTTEKESINEYLYDCVKASDTKDDSVPGTNHIVMKYDEVGKLLDMQYISEYTYNDEKQYNSAVEFYKEHGTKKYEYDDKSHIIKMISKEDISSKNDSEGNIIENWVKTYIDNYKKQGYICTKK